MPPDATGGQIFDTGLITSADGTNALKVDNVQVFGGYVLHSGAVEAGQLQVLISHQLKLHLINSKHRAHGHTVFQCPTSRSFIKK
jgi:alanyl-tRNA synthetase